MYTNIYIYKHTYIPTYTRAYRIHIDIGAAQIKERYVKMELRRKAWSFPWVLFRSGVLDTMDRRKYGQRCWVLNPTGRTIIVSYFYNF